jgi:hypothetical protein
MTSTFLDSAASPAVPGSGIRLGLTLYSLTSEFSAGRWDLDGMLRVVAEAGIGPGVEFNASQLLRSYPTVDPQFVREWRDGLEKYGLVPSSFGCNLDMGRRRDRDMTEDEEYEFQAAQFRAAHELGFTLSRFQSAKPTLIRRLLPLIEELDLTVGWELHAPLGPNSPQVLAIRELYDEIGSPRLGFVADFSSTMRGMSPALRHGLRKKGLDDEGLAELDRIWHKPDDINARHAEFVDYLNGRGIAPESLGSFARLAFNMHGHVPVAEWRDIMGQIVHVHAKFYDIDENGDEPAIDYPGLVKVFVDSGWQGYWSSEWEGHAFLDLDEADPVDLVHKQHDLIRRSIRTALDDNS